MRPELGFAWGVPGFAAVWPSGPGVVLVVSRVRVRILVRVSARARLAVPSPSSRPHGLLGLSGTTAAGRAGFLPGRLRRGGLVWPVPEPEAPAGGMIFYRRAVTMTRPASTVATAGQSQAAAGFS